MPCTTRWPRQRWGWRRDSMAPPSRAAWGAAGRRRTAAASSRPGRGASSMTATTRRRTRCWPRLTCWRRCPAGASRCSARCSSWATRRPRRTARWAPTPRARPIAWWWSARRPRTSLTGALAAGMPPGSVRRGRRSRRGAGAPAGGPAARRHAAGQGLAGRAAGPAGRCAGGGEPAVNGGETIVQGILLAFALVVILMPAFIRVVRRLGMGKRIRVEGPESHYTKEGTPTLGGLLIISVVGGVAIVMQMVSGNFIDGSTFAPLATLALVGILGTADDWLNARTGDGIRGRQKLLWQSVVALVAAWQIQQTYQITRLHRAPGGPRGGAGLGVRALRGLRHRGHQQRRQPVGWPRRPVRRAAHLRVRGLHGHRRGGRAAGTAPPGGAVRAHHRLAAGVPVVQRASRPDLHGRFRLAVTGCHAGGDRPHHRPDPAAAAHRHHLRARGGLGHRAGGQPAAAAANASC